MFVNKVNFLLVFVVGLYMILLTFFLFKDDIQSLASDAQSKLVDTTEYVVTDVSFKYERSFWKGNRSKVFFETADGLVVYPPKNVSYFKSETTGMYMEVQEYSNTTHDRINVYVGEDMISNVQTKYVSTFDVNIVWQN